MTNNKKNQNFKSHENLLEINIYNQISITSNKLEEEAIELIDKILAQIRAKKKNKKLIKIQKAKQ